MREVTVSEYGTEPAVALSPDEIDQLRVVAPSLAIAPSIGGGGLYDLTASSKVGVVQLPDLSVLIRPKLSIDRLLFLISYGLGAVRFQSLGFEFERDRGLFEAVIPGFASQIRVAFRRGLIQGYQVEEISLPGVRGRIRFEDQVRDRHGVFPPVEVRFDDYTEDVDVNRLIKFALGRLRRMRIRSDLARRELHAFDGALARVSEIEFAGGELPEPTFNRLNQHYEPAVRLAQLILRSTSFETTRGEVTASAFLVDMNRVFEDFVVAALRDALRLTEKTFPQGAKAKRLRLDHGHRIPLKPDISWWEGQRCVFVGDVKYKETRSERVPNADDLYQLLAYAIATDLPSGLLIYAAGEGKPGNYRVVHLDKTLEVITLDLAGTPDQVLSQMDEVADQIRLIRGKAIRARAA
jgi:5-methylcytosine-specific restriction enzyme subunit McrC